MQTYFPPGIFAPKVDIVPVMETSSPNIYSTPQMNGYVHYYISQTNGYSQENQQPEEENSYATLC